MDTASEPSLDELAGLLAGIDAWHFRPVPSLGIPPLEMADCGHGVTLVGARSSTATCFPTGIGMASTWNPELLEEAGRVVGRECRALGVSLLLGPMINLHRIPLNGRSFETFSEDPVLAGKLGAALVRGIQSTGTGACLKALAVNNQQAGQESTDVVVSERVLRELYLRNFEIAIRESQPLALMTSYSRLHGVNCAENRWLVKDIIKDEWAYPGVVISDWRAITTVAAYASGIDLEMPGPGTILAPEAVRSALRDGLITEQDVHDRGTRVLNLLRQLAQTAGAGLDNFFDTPEHRETARRVAEESIVLLKNQNGLLPLNPDRLTTLAVIGPNAAEARLGGGGSASVTPPYSISLLRGLREACGDRINISYEEGCGLVGTMDVVHGCFEHIDSNGKAAPGLLASFYNSGVPEGTPDDLWVVDRVDFSWGWASPGGRVGRVEYAVRFAGCVVPRHSGLHRFALYGQEGDIRLRINDAWLIDQWNGNGNFEDTYATKYQTVSLELTAGKPVDIEIQYKKRAARAAVRLEWEEPGVPSPIDRAVDLARRTEVVVLCLGLSNLFEGGSRDRKDMNLPDVQLELLRRIRAVNPNVIVVLNNGGPLVMPWADQVPAILEAWYPGQEGGSALARILLGEVNPSGRLPDTIPFRLEDHASMANYPGCNGEVRYEEGLMIGYRHFDHAGIIPHFPFGFGLSYTTFEIGIPKIEVDGDVTVSVTVTNTGSRAGAETVQVYVAPLNPPVLRPPQELKAFRKVTLNAGESRDLTFKLLREDFAYWDESRKDWTVAPGDYEIRAGSNSRDFRSVQVRLK